MQITSKKGANRSWPAPPSLPQAAEAAPQMTKTGQCGSCNAIHWDWSMRILQRRTLGLDQSQRMGNQTLPKY